MAEQPETVAPDPMDVLTRLTIALERMAEKQAIQPSEQTADILTRLSGAMERVAENQLVGADRIAKAQRPSNEVVPLRSVFNPRGVLLSDYHKPKLKCPMFLPWPGDEDTMTREEVELVNLLEQGAYRVKRTDGSLVKIDIVCEKALDETTISKLSIRHAKAFSQDEFKQMPPMADFYRQMLRQHSDEIRHAAAGVLTMDEEQALIDAGKLTVSV